MKADKQLYPYSAGDDDERLSFKSLISKYLRHWPVFICSLSLTVFVAFIANKLTPPVYKIQSKFLIKEESPGMDIFDLDAGRKSSASPKGQKLANESIILKSRSIAGSALDQLPFDVEYYDEGFFLDSEIYKSSPVSVEVDWNHSQLTGGRIRISWSGTEAFQLEFPDKEYLRIVPGETDGQVVRKPESPRTTFAFGKWIEFPSGRLRVNFAGAQQQGSVIVRLRDRASLLELYTGDNLQVFPVDKTSSILLLALDARQPHKGRDYLNALMRVFLENELHEKNTMARNTVSFIDSQLSGISDSLSDSQHKLETFRTRNKTYNITTEGNTLFEKLSELEKSLSQEKFKLEYYQNLQQYVEGEKYSEIVVPAGLGIEDPVLNKLIEDLIRFQSEKSRFLATQTQYSPAVVEVSRKIRDLHGSILEALKNVNRNTSMLIDDLTRRISRIERQFGKLPQTEQDMLNIKRSYSLNENIYTFLLQRRAEASISLASNMTSNKIIEPAILNLKPTRLRPLLNYFLAILLGVIVPVAFIFFRDTFSRKIRDLKEAEQRLAVPVLATVGKNQRYALPVVSTHPRARITEAFRAMRTNIDFILPASKQLTILVTSSIAGEGKSFCSLNLASVYAACGKKTVVVVCDMHKNFEYTGFKLLNETGLSTFLRGKANDLHTIVQKTDYADLDILVPGPVPPNPAELLISERFRHLLHDLKSSYDIIVLDSSPLGLTNETLYLTRMADLTLFVLRQNYSDKTFLDDLNAVREKKGIENLFAIFNDVEDNDLSYRGYGYGYYDDDNQRENTLRKVIRIISSKAAI